MRNFLLIPAAFLVLLSCAKDNGQEGGGGMAEPSVQSVSLSKSMMMLGTGVTSRLSAQSTPEVSSAFEWVSDDPSIASVSQDGLVTAIGTGETRIRAKLQGKEAYCIVSVCPSPQAVDLGVAGIKWATFNIGALEPSQNGLVFTWASTLPKSLNPKPATPYLTYVEIDGSSKLRVTKYCQKAQYGLDGFTDNLVTLQAEDDPATQILGAGWRTPTKNEFNQLVEQCQWSWDSGRNCFKIANRKNSANYIYLPVTGHPDRPSEQPRGYYWSSSLQESDPTGAYYFEIGHVNPDVNYDLHTVSTAIRYATYYLRAVKSN